MEKFRSLMRYMVVGILLIMLFQTTTPLLLEGSGVKIDDWAFNTEKVSEQKPNDKVLEYLIYLVSFWVTMEIIWFIAAQQGFASILTLSVIILVLASVAGPMIGSITDQGFRDMNYSVGGAKDVTNFRQNLARGYLPKPDSVTFEGLFYDYLFDTGEKLCRNTSGNDSSLLQPTISTAISENPLTGLKEYYLSVGFRSGIKADDWKRKKLNLVVVLDISGSMDSPFDNYYYGGYRASQPYMTEESKPSKLRVAAESVGSILERLQPEDSYGMVLFNHNAYMAKPVRKVSETDIASIKKHILDIRAQGATNMEAGQLMAMGMLEGFAKANPEEYENRIIFLTDAMPNTDDTSEEGLLNLTQQAEKAGTHMTFVGIGIDFNPELVEKITKVRGANYYSVNSSEQFKTRLVDEFDYMVSPMLYDFTFALDSSGFEIEKVYGSPEADEATGQIMKIRTLFPTKSSDEGARGGIVLLKLKKSDPSHSINFSITYLDRTGKNHQSSWLTEFPTADGNFHESSGIRKGIMLARYGELLKFWLGEEHYVKAPSDRREQYRKASGYWEQPGQELTIHQDWSTILRKFSSWFDAEITQVKDSKLTIELKTLKQLQMLSEKS